MGKGINVHLEARREMARETGRTSGGRGASSFEDQALEWKIKLDDQKEAEQRRKEDEARGVRTEQMEEAISLQKVSALERRQFVDTPGWGQYNPWKKQGEEKKQPRQLNTVTIWCMARKMMAQEWARAKGVKRKDPRIAAFERRAVELKEKMDEDRRKQEEEQRKILRQKELLTERLRGIGDQLLKEDPTAERAAEILQYVFVNGKVVLPQFM